MEDDEAKKGSEDKEKLEESILAEIKASEDVFKKGASLKESMESVLPIWKKDPPSEKVVNELYLLTAKIFEKLGGNKRNSPLCELSDENTAELMKFFYMTYQRITEGKDVSTLKPEKIYGIQQELIEKKGIGMLHRALFTTEREKKDKKEKKNKQE